MAIKTVYSLEANAEKAVLDLESRLSGMEATFIVFFASPTIDIAELAEAFEKRFPDASVIGCTTAGEIISGEMLKNSVVAMAFDAEALDDFSIGVVENLSSEKRVAEAFALFEQHTGETMMRLDVSKYVGIVLVDGLSNAEEWLIGKIGDLTNVTFIGGSAGDDLKFKSTQVVAGGKAYTDAAVLALLKPKAGFDLVKTESFSAEPIRLTATRVDESSRTVFEFNGEPAVVAYANSLGVPVENASRSFMSHPLGLLIGDEPFVRAPQRIQGEAMVFYCNIKEGMDLNILDSTDIVRDTRAVVRAKLKEHGSISGLINFHCILRTLELEQRGQMKEYAEIFSDIPTIGFSTYGEAFLGHINQTSTMLVFK